MKVLLALSVVLALTQSAEACLDRDEKVFPLSGVQYLTETNKSFANCVSRMAAVGVNLDKMTATRKNRSEGETGRIAYTISVQGKDSSDRTTRLAIKYDLSKHRFVCGKPSYMIPKCM